MSKGRLFGVGVGPGDPDLITVKALKIIRAAHVIAYPAARDACSNARAVIAAELAPEQIELPLIFPITTEMSERNGAYETAMREFYDASAQAIAAHLDLGRDVAVLCEGDPFFYGSYMYIHDRLAQRYTTEVVPGVTSISAGAARLSMPLVRRDSTLTILPGTLPEADLVHALSSGAALAIMKLGRNFTKVLSALKNSGVTERARYIERATMSEERIIPLQDVDPSAVPYFSLVLVPSRSHPANQEKQTHSDDTSGWIRVVGLGPGAPEWLSPEANDALDQATDLVGYAPYLDRVPIRLGQQRHASDNRVELERARHALELAESGSRVCVVSSGDPGIFAMATAVMEAIEHGPSTWRHLDVRVLPGISAMQAAAARVGAPLGHDFCVISLSDRLKPWSIIAQRLEAAASADFALALYNPLSSQRRRQLADAGAILRRHRAPQTPVVLARDVGGSDERVLVTDLAHLDAAGADMRTIVLVGASTTRSFTGTDGRTFVYTPRTYGAREVAVPMNNESPP